MCGGKAQVPWLLPSCHMPQRVSIYTIPTCTFLRASLSSAGKESACNAGDQVLFLGREDPLEKEMAPHSSILTWRIPWTEEFGLLQPMGWQESDTTYRLNRHHHSHEYKSQDFISSPLHPFPILPIVIQLIPSNPAWAFYLFSFTISVQFNSVTQSCLALGDPMDCSTPGFPVHHQLLEPTETHVYRVGDTIQPSHPLLSPSPPAFNLSQHQGFFQ